MAAWPNFLEFEGMRELTEFDNGNADIHVRNFMLIIDEEMDDDHKKVAVALLDSAGMQALLDYAPFTDKFYSYGVEDSLEYIRSKFIGKHERLRRTLLLLCAPHLIHCTDEQNRLNGIPTSLEVLHDLRPDLARRYHL